MPVAELLGSSVAKVVSAVVPKLASGAAKQLKDQKRLDSGPGFNLTPSAVDSVLKRLKDREIRELNRFVEGPEFFQLIWSLLSNQTTAWSATSSDEAFTVAQAQLRELLRIHVGISDVADRFVVGDILLGEVLDKVASLGSYDSKKASAAADINKKSRRAAAKRNADLLASISDYARISSFLQDYRTQVTSLHSRVRVSHAGPSRFARYEDIFVPPYVAARNEAKEMVSAEKLIEQENRFVVLGDPGGGKSTLSTKVVHDLAASNEEITPFLFILRDFAGPLGDSNTSILGHLESICRSVYNIDPPEGGIEYALLNRSAVVVFDGLDELTNISMRSRVVDSITTFANRYPAVKCMVTSRRIGYYDVPLDRELFDSYELRSFTTQQTITYAHNWFRLDESVGPQERRTLTQSFLRDSNLVPDLRSNPLMLALICSVYSADRYIPKNRPEVFEKCATMMFERWDKQRNIVAQLSFDAHVRSAMYAIAHYLVDNERADEGMSRSNLVAFVKNFLHGRRFRSSEEAENAAEEFVDFCTGRAWVLTDVGSTQKEELYGFTHRTFLEYFAARQLVRANESLADFEEALYELVISGKSDVVAQLAAQIYSSQIDDGASKVLSDMLTRLERASTGALRSFIARALSYMVPSPAVVDKIVANSFDVALALNVDPIQVQENSAPLADTMLCMDENADAVAKALGDRLRKQLRLNPQESLLALAAYPAEFARSYSTRKGVSYGPDFKIVTALRRIAASYSTRKEVRYAWFAPYQFRRGELPLASGLQRQESGLDIIFLQTTLHNTTIYSTATGLCEYLARGIGGLDESLCPGFNLSATTAPAIAEITETLFSAPTPWHDPLRDGTRGYLLAENFRCDAKTLQGAEQSLYLLLMAYFTEYEMVLGVDQGHPEGGSGFSIEYAEHARKFERWKRMTELDEFDISKSGTVDPRVGRILRPWVRGALRLLSPPPPDFPTPLA